MANAHISGEYERTYRTNTLKITEPVRSSLLRRPLKPSVTRDSEIPGFALHVTTRRAFYALSYQPHGINPSTGKRWGGGVRYELGDAQLMPVQQARTAALTAKSLVRAGKSPHHEAMAQRQSVATARGILPTTVGQMLEAYEAALMARRQPLESTRRATVHYARKAVRLMKAETLATIDATITRVMIETMIGSDDERHSVFGGLNRFLNWCVRQRLVETNVCSAFDHDEKPRRGTPRDHVPSLEELRAVWNAVEDEAQRDLIRFMLLVPLRRNEAAGLMWSEVDLQRRRVRISANRMKMREAHELPLSAVAAQLLEAREATGDLIFQTREGGEFTSFAPLLDRIRARIDQNDRAKAEHFVLHDIRRAFVSHLAERGYDVDLLDQCLGHTRKGVLGVYQRASRMAERERAMEAWSKLVTSTEVERDNVVVAPFARAR
jgi:integrase